MTPVLIRPAVLQDAAALASVHILSWQTTYTGLLPDSLLSRLPQTFDRRLAYWRQTISAPLGETLVYVADIEGEVVGFVSGGKVQNIHPPFDSELYVIYLLQKAQGQGIGKKLTAMLVDELRARGYSSMIVWVLKGNVPAIEFYKSLGGVYVTEKEFEMGGHIVTEEAYGWAALSEVKITP